MASEIKTSGDRNCAVCLAIMVTDTFKPIQDFTLLTLPKIIDRIIQ
jgi:hypothetical protein